MVAKLSPKSSGAIDLYIDFLTVAIYKHAGLTSNQIRKIHKRRMVVNNFSARWVEDQVIRPPLDPV